MFTRRGALRLLSAGIFAPYLSLARARQKDDCPPLGLNLSGTAWWASEQPFANLAHNAAPWRLQVRDAPFTWDEPLPPLTPDGYPLHVPEESFVDSFLIFTPHRQHLPATLFLHYEGQGRLAYLGGAELQERSEGYERVRNLRRPDPFTLRLVHTDPDDPVRNIRLLEQKEPALETFRSEFLDRLRGMSVLRFMDWMATNNAPLARWGERPAPSSFGRSAHGVALETMIELANRTGIPPWFNMPHKAQDEYVIHFADQVLRDLDPDLTVYVEYSNEVWNTMFDQAAYAREQGLALELSPDPYEAQLRFYARRTTEILQMWEQVFEEQASRVLGVYAAQSANPWTSEIILNSPQLPKHADVLAVAPYFGGSLGSPEAAPQVQNWNLDRLFAALREEVEGENRRQIRSQAAIARRHGLLLAAYEGGQHLVGSGGMENNERLSELFVAANRDARMGELYARHLAIWNQAGGGPYALFASMAEPSKWGSWGLLEFEGDRQPRWDTIRRLLDL